MSVILLSDTFSLIITLWCC